MTKGQTIFAFLSGDLHMGQMSKTKKAVLSSVLGTEKSDFLNLKEQKICTLVTLNGEDLKLHRRHKKLGFEKVVLLGLSGFTYTVLWSQNRGRRTHLNVKEC